MQEPPFIILLTDLAIERGHSMNRLAQTLFHWKNYSLRV